MKNNIVEFGYPNLDNYFKKFISNPKRKNMKKKKKFSLVGIINTDDDDFEFSRCTCAK